MHARSWIPLNLLVGSLLASACGGSTTGDGDEDGGTDPYDGCPRQVIKKETTKEITGVDLCAALGENPRTYEYIDRRGRGQANLPTDCGEVCGSREFNVCFPPTEVAAEVARLAEDARDAGAADAGTRGWCEPLEARSAIIQLTCRRVDTEGTRSQGCPVEGRRPEHFQASSPQVGDVVAGYLAACAELEAASIPAFARLARELEAHGAPPSLVLRAESAGADEVRHMASVDELARSRGARAVHYAAPSLPVRALVEMAIENAVEGVVREGFGAVQALCKARRAKDAGVRAAYAQIAREECLHADLAADVARFCATRLEPAEQQRVHEATEAAIAELTRELDADVHPVLVRELGLPSRAESLTLVAGLRHAMWRSAA